MKDLPVRKKIRLDGYDYSNAGYYFVTICVQDRHEMLGKVVGATVPGHPSVLNVLDHPYVALTPLGACVDETIQTANKNGVIIDKYAIMPNHIHMIVILEYGSDDGDQGTGDRGRSPLQYVVRNIKSYVTKWAGFSIWQKSYHEHIVRDETEYQAIWRYIDENPARWTEDQYYEQITLLNDDTG